MIYILGGLLALPACTAESIKTSLLQQEKDIERYIETLKKNTENPVDTVYYFGGVYRVVLEAGVGEGAAAGDSVVFDYKAYMFASGKGAVYDSLQHERGTLGQGSYFAGLETGLTGMLEGEQAQVILTSEKGYGSVAVGIVPPNTPLLFEIKMDRVVKN
ncbi:MAG: FKBP-type peptidyl-prolyl cis-trans isomerase [Prevotellaceae bacterium]|jgi:peptidylprolyl isomerase/FKBP-type peptidyl-prolyl cis-trans isomerase FkpA|nr:FKBP-type peptidyl-prolyl cis-trans isomerase [Prevotellaceae bacterium]